MHILAQSQSVASSEYAQVSKHSRIASWSSRRRRRFAPSRVGEVGRLDAMLTIFGALAVTFMMVMYALERQDRRFVLAFACGCGLSSAYGFLAGIWPFGVVEAIWALVALRRWRVR